MANNLSYWEKTQFFNFDVIIVGSGIVGLNAAIHLKKSAPKLKIAILERGFLPMGASTKNAGFACFGSVSELIEQEKIAGTDALAILIERRWKGLLKLRDLLGEKTIDYQCLGGYELFRKDEAALSNQCVAKIEHFNHLIRNIVGADAFSLSNTKIKTFGFSEVECLIANQYEAQIDSGKMMLSLLQLAQQQGILVFNNCKVDEILNVDKGVEVLTDQGKFIAKKIIVATNAFINSLLPDLEITPGRGQVLITAPIKNLKVKGTFHYDKGYYYFRNIDNRILLGGGRNLDFAGETTTNFGQTEAIQQALEELLKSVILPDVEFVVEQRWSGVMAFGKVLEPLIKEVSNNVFCATRCNGMGIAIGSQTGADVSEMVLRSL
ncbi:FAD-dependent oxidoreductase [Pedobacter yonginense]|uniref:FAD-dependent oxidoreductase n=1 Tax=Pedobacter yonginense TaxID=651869 RepID=A0A317ERW5_9SPHI|nr:FAD-binding oxidoreductase [Pedobacter yonginense]PWS27908.1 FAD-dependent oxidoreductase [Pedobacter yonginense]